MGARGKLPDPNSISTAQGQNALANPLKPEEGSPIPNPPEELPESARAFWTTHAADLHSRGLLTARDLPAFERTCRLWHQLQRLDEQIEHEGSTFTTTTGQVKQNPAAALRLQTERQFLQHCSGFAMTPAARLRIPSSQPEQKPRMRRDRLAAMRAAGMELDDTEMEALIFGE